VNRKTVYLHLRESDSGFSVVKLAKTRDAATRDGDVVMPLEIELPWDFFSRAAIRVRIEPMTGEKR
jgi:hypothetical protein